MAAEEADHILKSGQVSAMIKQGFLPSPSRLSPNHCPVSRVPNSPPFSSSPTFLQHPSPPPPPPPPPSTATPLFGIIAEDDHRHRHCRPQQAATASSSTDQRRIRLQERICNILEVRGYASWGSADVELSVSSGDGFRVTMRVHRRVLARRSRFFAEKLVGALSHVVEICDCDDAEVYAEAVAYMYCDDLRRRLAREGVAKLLALLKVSAAIMFDVGVSSCLENLEAIPWSEEEEERVISVLSQLKPCKPAAEVLQRVSVVPLASMKAEWIILRLLSGVLDSKHEKARREMKNMMSSLLSENVGAAARHYARDRLNVSKETLYHLCHKCLSSLLLCSSEAARAEESRQDRGGLKGDIAWEADNLQWLVEILISKRMGDEFVRLWADQKELARLHPKIPSVFRYEISRITAQLCISIGKRQILVAQDARFSLLQTWLEALYEDFGWMKRACKLLDKKMVEDGMSETILTLPMAQQQAILLNWFDRFLNKGDDCPNIQRAFEVWWRRAFARHYVGQRENSRLQISVCDYPT